MKTLLGGPRIRSVPKVLEDGLKTPRTSLRKQIYSHILRTITSPYTHPMEDKTVERLQWPFLQKYLTSHYRNKNVFCGNRKFFCILRLWRPKITVKYFYFYYYYCYYWYYSSSYIRRFEVLCRSFLELRYCRIINLCMVLSSFIWVLSPSTKSIRTTKNIIVF